MIKTKKDGSIVISKQNRIWIILKALFISGLIFIFICKDISDISTFTGIPYWGIITVAFIICATVFCGYLFFSFLTGCIFRFNNNKGIVYINGEEGCAVMPLKDITEVSYTLKYGNMVISYQSHGSIIKKDVLLSLRSLERNEINFLIDFFASAGKKVVNADERKNRA